jgi:hypothetical protein
MPKGTTPHRQWGRRFVWCVLLVCATAIVGNLFFRFSPVFALLTVLVLYQMVSGWRSIRTKQGGPSTIDAAWTGIAIVASGLIMAYLLGSGDKAGSNFTVVYATFSAIGAILAYDVLRWFFPRRWFARVWIYDHIYKLISSFGALLSAFAGNTLRFAQPWSQILPSVIGGSLIVWYFVRQARRRGHGQVQGTEGIVPTDRVMGRRNG